MLNVLLAQMALGAVLGVGSRAAVLFLPSIAALIEGALISSYFGYPFVPGCVITIAILASVQVGYILGSMASVKPDAG